MRSLAPLVSIIIPTLRRPASLVRALRSAVRQDAAVEFEVVVVDNDPDGSAAATVRGIAKTANLAVLYVSAPVPGVANARNAGMAASRGPFIAFLDDDEEASPSWLANLLKVQAETLADAVFGPVRAEASGAALHRTYLESFFSRTGPSASGLIDGPYGCGNSLVRRAAMPDTAAPFAVERNQIGGEDDLLFDTMKRCGARFAWAAEAWVYEHPEASRLCLRYALTRAFAFGQGPTSAAWAAGPRAWPAIPVWMAWGFVQLCTFGAAAALQWITGGRRRAFTLDRAVQGLGKVLWFPPFKIGFYGAARS